MSVINVSVTVPVSLSHDKDGYWLGVRNSQGQEAVLSLEHIGNVTTKDIVRRWAAEQLVAHFKARRRSTGIKDHLGTLIHEGDILEDLRSGEYVNPRGVVRWSEQKAAFVLAGSVENGSPWETANLSEVRLHYVIVGNAIEHSERLFPAVPNCWNNA